MIDIDTEVECQPNCPEVATCDGINPLDIFCPSLGTTVGRCTWSVSNNLMSQGWNQYCITPCQWETIYNFVVSEDSSPKYRWANNCTEIEAPYKLAEGTHLTWDNLMLLNRDIIIPKTSSLTISCEVRMAEGTKFIVERGGKLIVDGGKITNLCPDTRWHGIYVHGNGNKPQPEPFGSQAVDDAGIVIIQNESLIERSTTAIRTRGEGAFGGFDYFGGVVYAENSEFINNGRVAEFMKYGFPNKSQFIDCTIDKTSEWEIDATGVTIWDCHDITFSGNTFSNLDGTGISGIHYGANVVNVNKFHNCNRGIELFSTSPGQSWLNLLGGNDFQNNGTHLIANDALARTSLQIIGNTFGPSTWGVWIEGESQYLISSNTFDDNFLGLSTVNTGAPTNFIDNNSFETSYYSMIFSGNNQNTRFIGNCYDMINSVDVALIPPLNGSGTTQIQNIQSRGGNPAANCFNTTSASVDIATSSQTSTFKYVVPQDNTVDPCFIPQDNLSDGGANNYELVFVDEQAVACVSLIPDPEPEPPTEEKLNQKSQSLQLAWQAWQSDLPNLSKETAYYQALADFEDVRNRLLSLWQQNGQYTKVDSLLALDTTLAGKQRRIGFQFGRNNLNSVATLLAAYPNNDANDQRYLDIQNIYLQYLQAPTTFSLTSAQDQFLRTTAANQQVRYRGQAAALLNHLTGEPFEIGIPNINPPPALRQLPTTDQPVASYRVYPNPSNRLITIELPDTQWDQPAPLNCRVYNTQGQEVYQQLLEKAPRTQLDLPERLEGIYWLEITSDQKRLHTQRIVLIK
jgi:hypothetical protein